MRTTCWLVAMTMGAATWAGCVEEEVGRSLGAHSEVHKPDAGFSPDEGCTYTQGFWKNHPEAVPVDGLNVGGQYYTAAEVHQLLWTPPAGDLSVALARQLLAALYNVANGASGVPAIGQAQAWMGSYADADGRLPYGVGGGTAAGQEASALIDALAAYNEGLKGPGHCDERPSGGSDDGCKKGREDEQPPR